MKFAWLSKILLLAVFAFTIASCDKDPVPVTPETPSVGGLGGHASLRLIPEHDGDNIDSCIMYIKYNTLDLPLTYDDSLLCHYLDGTWIATFHNLKPGNYYIQGKGWDNKKSEIVEGGVRYTIKTDYTQGNVIIPVITSSK